MLRRLPLLGLLLGLAVPALAQPAPDGPADGWHLGDAEADGVYGLSLDRAYETLADREPQRTVVVAVIDSGVDIEHEDLAGQIWTNEDEIPGNGLDDDGNGYADDVHGWNFIGGPDGRHVKYDTFELAREVARLRREAAATNVAPEARARLVELEAELAAERAEYEGYVAQLGGIAPVVQRADALVRDHFQLADADAYTTEDLQALATDDPALAQSRDILLYLAANGLTARDLADQFESLEARLRYGLDPDFDPRGIVGDDYADAEDRFYGNPDVAGPDPSHGTAVAGVIAAVRGNGLGIDGVAPGVLVMPIRAVPNGDERDKDVANAIRYAVDNGADVVNMSFGKGLSPEKPWVDAAVRYAEARGVLLVHAAGNDGADIDVAPNFPNRLLADGPEAANWIEVGASRWDAALAASFSNYGQTRVDVFAPGERITTLAPGDRTTTTDGTSLAAPLVSGVAALLLAYYPDLAPADVRTLLLDTATRHDAEVPRPGSETGEAVGFGALSATGGVVNAHAA
ncbi:MAG: S8 family peptidase, partial [Rubricoccaceae bacterium]|nr:S8 family peptidase [Rubricoccaceae bacterium]